ncbi:MAG TPA: serine hydrolase domain-containing protein, partial [Propionibacteriaceae bacterium]|nr:serine hydrolase domain-containing protein [Propionibacteriaceae bacterium]
MAFLDALEDRPDIEMHSVMVVRHGHVVAEGWWAPYSAERPHLLYSLSKIFTSTAAAFAQAEGLLDLEDTVVSHFGEFEADITDRRSRAITLRHVAAMASGHTREMLSEAAMRDPGEPIRGFLSIPPDRDPGTVFAYSQPCTFALASVIQRGAGVPLTEYLRPRLFDPLGIGHVGWQTWSSGLEQGFSGLHARTEDIAKLGQLYLQRGRWGDTQLIGEEWVANATSIKIDTPGEANTDWRQGYGFQFWMARHGYRGDGAFGQFCVILPEHDTVIATTACTMDMQAVLDAMWTYLLPGLGVSTPDANSAQERLDARLSDLRLPTCFAEPRPKHWHDWVAEPFTLAAAAEGIQVPSMLTSIEVPPAVDGLKVTLIEPSNALTISVGTGNWTVSTPTDSRGDTIPVAASGGWLDDHTLRVEVIFLETPHRMDIACSLTGRTAEAVWRQPPLFHARLERLHSPS